MECRYPSIIFENMWKYVTRRFRDTLERGANDFGRCSTTLVNNGAVNHNDEKNDSPSGPTCKWLSLRKSKLYHNDRNPNVQTWSFEHRNKIWMGAKLQEQGSNRIDGNGNPSSFGEYSEVDKNVYQTNNMKWCFKNYDGEQSNAITWENDMKHLIEDIEKVPDTPLKCQSYLNDYGGRNTTKWTTQHRDRNQENGVDIQNNYDEKNSTPPSMWISLRKCCKSYRNRDGTNGNKWSFQHMTSTWIDAITWSGLAILGWYTSQLIHLKLKQHCRFHEKKCSSVNNLLSSIYPYTTDVNVNQSNLYADSVSKIGKVLLDFTPTVYLMSNDQSENDKVSDTISSNRTDSSTHTHSHRSDTSDDDLGGVLNSIENRLGLASIENGQYQDGLSLLRSAAERNYAPALYNLGLCYEKGLGVTANEKTAMELYKSAAALHHPEALYNLGIYYGQGRGGLKPDKETAVRLLRLAAVQGKQEAIDALKYLDESIPERHHNDVSSWTHQHAQFSSSQNIVPTQSRLFIENINFLQAAV